MSTFKQVLVTGGAGYVGAVLVPKLLAAGYKVKVIDLFIFGADVLAAVKDDPNLEQIKGDIRDRDLLKSIVPGCDAVIHLACISNDPSFELDPQLGRSVNYDCFRDLVCISRDSGVRRFIYASSSSVYGIKTEPDVTEDLPLKPLTDYSKYKALCEAVLSEERRPGFVTLILRPATICGFSPRLRLDLTVNILTSAAFHQRRITVLGGAQMRPNLHIEDMTDVYLRALEYEDSLIDGQIFNVGYQNLTVMQIAEKVRSVAGDTVEIEVKPTNDNRSYHVSSSKIERLLGFKARHSVEDAINDLWRAFQEGKVPNALHDDRYYNIRTMQRLGLK